MALNYLWIGFFLIAFLVGLVRLIFFGDFDIFPEMMQATFDNAKTGFDISLGLTGALTLWLGIMRIGEKGGMVNLMSRAIGPFFNRLFLKPNQVFLRNSDINSLVFAKCCFGIFLIFYYLSFGSSNRHPLPFFY